jgi:hypothetical protein
VTWSNIQLYYRTFATQGCWLSDFELYQNSEGEKVKRHARSIYVVGGGGTYLEPLNRKGVHLFIPKVVPLRPAAPRQGVCLVQATQVVLYASLYGIASRRPIA